MEDAIGDRDLKKMTKKRFNLIDGSISSYCSIINSPKYIYTTKKTNNLVAVLGDIESNRLGGK